MSQCDNNAKMSYPGVFTAFVDFASEHAEDLNMGKAAMDSKDLMWVATKTKICFHERPELLDTVQLSTWPGVAERSRCNRYYTMTKDGKLLAEGKTEWAVLSKSTGRPHRISEAYPEDMEICTDTVCDVPYHKISDDFSKAETIWHHTVSSCDIDLSNHMNNCAYVRRIFNCFQTKKLAQLPIREAEIIYRLQCYEDEELTMKIRANETGFDIGAIKDDGRAAAIMRFVYK